VKQNTEKVDFGAFGIVIGVAVIIITIVCVVFSNLVDNEDASSGITWVG
jgi:hypothetical protein